MGGGFLKDREKGILVDVGYWGQLEVSEGFCVLVSQNKELDRNMWMVAGKIREFIKKRYCTGVGRSEQSEVWRLTILPHRGRG